MNTLTCQSILISVCMHTRYPPIPPSPIHTCTTLGRCLNECMHRLQYIQTNRHVHIHLQMYVLMCLMFCVHFGTHSQYTHTGAASSGGCFPGTGVHSGGLRLGSGRSCAESQARDGMSYARGSLRPVPRDLWVSLPPPLLKRGYFLFRTFRF